MSSLTFDNTENKESNDSKMSYRQKQAVALSKAPKVSSKEQYHIDWVRSQENKNFTIVNVPEETREAFLEITKHKKISGRELLSKLLIKYGEDILDLEVLNPTRKGIR